MKKLIFAIVAIMLTTTLLFACKGKTDKKESEGPKTESSSETSDEVEANSHSGLLSDRDIYYHPDTVLPNNPTLHDMVDLANGYAIMRAVYCDAELWFRFGTVVNTAIKKIKTDVIGDPDIREAAKQFVKEMVNVLPNDTNEWNENDERRWEEVNNAIETYAMKMAQRYALSHYGEITQEGAMEYLDILQFIPTYDDAIVKMRHKPSKENADFLVLKAKEAKSFDVKCLFTLEYAHQQQETDPHPSIAMMEALMKSGNYSRYLPDVWRTWRVLKQIGQSPSRDGVIHNYTYNKMRFHCLNAIMRHLISHPKDIYAINTFCYLATYDNIVRYNEFPYGNSAMVEEMKLFPEIKKE